MPLTEPTISRTLMKWRTRVSAAAWVVVQDTHAAKDIFQSPRINCSYSRLEAGRKQKTPQKAA